ncbi:MAG: hypothetical protein ACQKBW_04225 [Puniceicoccales bacterium]
MIPLSELDAPLTPLNASPLGKWHPLSDDQHQIVIRDRFVTLVKDPDWRKAADPVKNEPAYIAAMADIYLDSKAPLKVQTSRLLAYAAVDGKQVELTNGETPSLDEGDHRVLLVFDTEGKNPSYRETPQLLVLTAGDKPVTWLPAPIAE